jgi:glycosyltransferase involved in cell wall biosynthesis
MARKIPRLSGFGGSNMKVLVISAAYPPFHAGEATNTYFLCKQLVDRKLDVHVLTSQGCTGNGEPGITIHPIMDQWSWTEISRFKVFLRGCAPDAIYLMYLGVMYHYHPMITFTPTIAKKLLPHVPFVTRFENVRACSDPSRTSLVSRVFRKYVVQEWAGRDGVSYNFGTLMRDSDSLIVLCKMHQLILFEERHDIGGKTTLIPPPPNMRICEVGEAARQSQRAKLGVEPGDFVFAFLGYIYPAKGVETLLRAFQIVMRQKAQAKLLFVGGKFDLNYNGEDVYVEQMYALSKELKVESNIVWTGSFNADSEDGSLYLRAADAGVFTFIKGVQLNNSSFSSMASHGLPMIATIGPWLDEPFVHQENVLLCEPNDPNVLAQSMLLMMEKPELRERLRRGALKLASEWFSWERAADRTIDLLQGPALSHESRKIT